MPWRRGSVRALLATLLSAGAIDAQSEDLVELYQAARVHDAAYLSARALAASAEYRAAQVRALRLPRIDGTASAGYTEADPPPSSTNPTGRRVGTQAGALAVVGTQPLYNPANRASIEQAQRQLEVASADLITAEQDLILRLAQAYFDVLAAQDTLNNARGSKAAITEQLASAQRNFEVGNTTITDAREAQARYDLATAQEIAADNDLRIKRLALDQRVGRTGVQPWPVGPLLDVTVLAPGEVSQWTGAADLQHPAVRRARLAQQIAALESDKARAASRPTVDLVSSVALNRGNGSGSTLQGNAGSANVGLQLNVPLFAGHAIENRLRETVVLEEKARQDLEAARRDVAQATRQAYFTVQSGQAQVKALEAAEVSSRLALEATQLGYRVGVRVSLDVLNAQSQLYQTQTQLARARYDLLIGSLRLRQAAGSLSPADVAAVNQLLLPP